MSDDSTMRAVFDGTLQSAAEYDPFGGPIVSPIGTAYGFTGELTDDNGLVYLRARYLAPSLGTFASRDPWRGSASAPRTWNGYAWVEGNVVNRVDPGGMAAGIAACESSAPLIEALKTTARSSTEYDGVSHYTRGIGLSATMPFPYSYDDDDNAPLTDEERKKKADQELCSKWAEGIKKQLDLLVSRIRELRLDRHNLWDIRLLPGSDNRRIIGDEDKGSWRTHQVQANETKAGLKDRVGKFKRGPNHGEPCPDPDNLVSSTESVLAVVIDDIVPDRVAQQEQSGQPQTPPDPANIDIYPPSAPHAQCDLICQLLLLLAGKAATDGVFAPGGLSGGFSRGGSQPLVFF